MTSPKINAIEWATLEGRRPRVAGCNARLGVHGLVTRVPMVRLTDSDGAQGFGAGWVKGEQARKLLGMELDQLFSPEHGTADEWLAFDYPLWDLTSKRAGLPAYTCAAQVTGRSVPTHLRAPCYDTSLYIDDLHLPTDDAAAQFIADEACQGMARGHRAFKLKIGRGAMHMPLIAGTARDVAVIRAVRQAIGSQATLMVDVNNGFNLNLAKDVLDQTRNCSIFWLEEPFHEDAELYRNLKGWLFAQQLPVLIADGEGDAHPRLLDWAQQKLVDVIQYDVIGHGFTRWLHTGKQLDDWDVRSAPHHYGTGYGNYVACHLAGAITHFASVEWDETETAGLAAPGYHIKEGHVSVPQEPGFGVQLDDDRFTHAVQQGGGVLRV